jgi:predicted CopG family antitoxin
MSYKTIGISETNYERLRRLGEKGTTFDEIITMVLNQVKESSK